MDAAIYQRLHPHTYLERFLEQGIRTDGRKTKEWRSVALNVGSISTAEGSALVRWGDTTIVCGVKAEIAEPELDRPEDGWIVPNIDLPPLCSPKYRPGPPADDCQILSDKLFDVLSTVVDTKTLCIEPSKAAWVLYVDATCINYDGSAFDACLLAMIAALKDTKLPKATYNPDTGRTLCSRSEPTMSLKLLPDPPLSFTFGTFQSYLLADLTSFEEPLLESTISVLVCGGGTLFSIVQEGFSASAAEDGDKRRGGSEKVEKVCIEEATSRRKEVLKLLGISL